MIQRPQYMQSLRAYRDVPLVKVLSGIRRCGKSTLLELLKEGEELSLCRHLETGREMYILNAYLRRDPERGLWCEDSTDYRLPVEAGDVLTVVRRIKTGALCKKDGVTGWYFGRLTKNLT